MSRRHAKCSFSPWFWFKVTLAIVVVETIVILCTSVNVHISQWIYANIRNLSNEWFYFHDPNLDESADSFLSRYKGYCNESLVPSNDSVRLFLDKRKYFNSSKLCDCIPETIVGTSAINYTTIPSIEFTVSLLPELEPGGQWSPKDCFPRQRVAVIIPFRDRGEHLKILLHFLHPFLQRQKLSYMIFVVEQADPEVFNKAMLMNVGFREANAFGTFDCYIFHDVDMLPEDDRNFYVCSPEPRHVGVFIDKWDYRIPYEGIFGGVTAFTKDHFELVNGFSNQYYGWGGEDDDMFKRIQAKNMKITRFPKSVARFNMIKHEADEHNPYNYNSELGYRYRPDHYRQDGLSSLVYKRKAAELRPLYYWLYISLPPTPENFKGYRRRPYRSSQGCSNVLYCCVTEIMSVTLVVFFGVHTFSI